MKIKVALFGGGRIGKMHLKILSRHKNFEVVFIVDDLVAPEDFPGYIVKKSENIDEVLSSNIDAIVIATPTPTHEGIIHKAILHKKSIFCEKPISTDLNKLMNIKKLLWSEDIKLQVGLNRRFDPDLKELRRLVLSGKIGRIYNIKITNRDPRCPFFDFMKSSGGIFFDFNVHDFDMIRYITGYKVVQAYAIGSAFVLPRLKEINDIDTTLISLKLEDGSLGLIDCTRETNFGYDQRVEVFGSKGMLQLDNIGSTKNLYISDILGSRTDLPLWSFVERYAVSFKNEFDAFYQYIAGYSQNSPAGICDVIDSVKVALATQDSFNKNTPCNVNY
jgi:myo-inositol 2-dehydrogenase/D-chiro-inositol 1-dehydrogenase